MQFLIALLCMCTMVVPVLLGVGFTFLAERRLGRLAYAIGGLLPVIIVVILYGAYDVALRVTGCEPADSLACGQPLGATFLFSVGFLCITLIASGLAQAAVFFFLNGRRYAQMQAYMEPGEQAYMQPEYEQYGQGYMQQDSQAYAQTYQPQEYMPGQVEQYTQPAEEGYLPQEPQAYPPAMPPGQSQQELPPASHADSEQDDLRRYMPPESRTSGQPDDSMP